MAEGDTQNNAVGKHGFSLFLRGDVRGQIASRDPNERVSWNWYDTWHEEHHRAFVVAKMCKADLLQDVHDSLQKAREEGQSFAHWRREIEPKLKGRWLGRTHADIWVNDLGRDIADLPEKDRNKTISPKRLEKIYRVNMRVAQAAGHYNALMDKANLFPYWRYNTAEDDRVRESHKVLHNMVFRYDDPFWDTHFPPNGWNCRCYVRAMDDRDLQRLGLEVTDSRDLETREDESAGGHTKLTYIIGGKEAATADGWNYNPGRVNQQTDDIARKKAEGYEKPIADEFKKDLKKGEEEQRRQTESKPSKPAQRADISPKKPTVAKNATPAHPQQHIQLKETVQQKISAGVPLSSDEYKDWLGKTLPLAHERAKLQQSLENAKDGQAKFAAIKDQMADIGRQIAEFGGKVIVAKIPEHIIAARNKVVELVNNAAVTGKKKRHLSNISDNSLWMDIDSGARHATREDKVHPNPDAITNIHSYLERAQNAGEYGGVFCEYDTAGVSVKHDGDIVCVIPDNNAQSLDSNSYCLTKIIIVATKGELHIKTVQKITKNDFNSYVKNMKIWHRC